MAWTIRPNAHVQIWLSADITAADPPTADPDYDGTGQLLTPTRLVGVVTPETQARAWIQRLVVPPTALGNLGSIQLPNHVIGGVSLSTIVAVVDDTGASMTWFIVNDISPSTTVTGGIGTIDAVFLAMSIFLPPPGWYPY